MLMLAIPAVLICVASLTAGMAIRTRLLRRPAAAAVAVTVRAPGRWRSVAGAVLRPDGRVAALAVWLTLLDTTLALAAPWPLQFVVDYAIGGKPFPSWLAGLHGLRPGWLAGAAATAGLLVLGTSAFAAYLVTFLTGTLREHATLRLRAGLLGHLVRAVPGAVARYPLGELTSRIGPDVRQVTETVTTVLETLIPDVALVTGMTVVTALVDWRLTLVVLCVLPLYVATSRMRNRSLRGAQKRARARSGDLAALTSDQLARLPAVHLFDQGSAEIARHTETAARSAGAAIAALDASAKFRPITEFLPGLGLAAALVAGTIEVTSGRLTVGGLLVFLAYLSSLTGPVHSLATLSTAIARGEASRDRVAELLDLPVLEPVAMPLLPGHRSLRSRGAALRLERVSYSHSSGQLVLDQVSLSLRPGKLTCLTGPSGAGKSTLLSLLVRLADPQSGSILIDGQDIAALPLSRLRQLVTLVPQDPWLHTGTIAENIFYGRPEATLAEMLASADHAGVAAFARQLPDGFDSQAGEHGTRLSGGQQRRIALARALLRDTPLLLLDEPTAGLDPVTETALIEGLIAAASGKTILMVTHSPRLAGLADDVIRLDGGRAVLPESVLPCFATSR